MTRTPLVLGVLLAATSSAHAGKLCLVSGTEVTLHGVTVKPSGEDPFEVSLHKVPASAEVPARCGGPITVHVTGAVELTARREDIWFRLSSDVRSPDGLVTAEKGAQVIDLCMRGDQVFGSAVMYADDVLEGEAKRPDILVRDVEIPCGSLTLDLVETTDPEPTAVDLADTDTHRYWELRNDDTLRVTLHARPNLKAKRRVVESPSCSGCIYLRQIALKKGWVKVASDGEGVTATGWVPTSKLKRIPDHTLVGHSYMCTGDHPGDNTFGFGGTPPGVKREGTVWSGTVIYASEGSGEWGRFALATRVTVRIQQGASWAQLTAVPGLDAAPGYVPVDTLTLDP